MSTRLMLESPATEDNAAAAYQQVADNRAAASALEWLRATDDAAPVAGAGAGGAGNEAGNLDVDKLMGGGEVKENPAAEADGQVPAAEAKAEEPAGGDSWAQLGSDILKWHVAAGKDIAGGAVEAPGQAVGGVVDAFGEVDQFMQQMLPIGGAQLFNDAGEFDPSLLSADEMKASREDEETIFDMVATDKADTVTGGFVRATSQFLTGFIPGMKAMRGLGAIKAGAVLQPLAAGAIADMVVFDPNEDRLSTFLNQIPALSSIVPDYLADNEPDQSHWEGRLKNAIEGAGLGLATDGLMSAFKYYKASRAAKAADRKAANPLGATVEAAKDELKQAARSELVQDIPDEALRPLGDMADDAPLLVETPANVTAGEAFTRMGEARARAAQHDADAAVLEKINGLRERFSGATGKPEKGTTRYYYGSADETHDVRGQDELWVSPDPEYARNYRRGEKSNSLWYVDVPDDQRGPLKVRDEINGYNTIGKLPKEWAGKARRLKEVAAVGRDPMDDMLDELRSGAVSNAKIPKRPVTAIVKSLGGIDPTSSLAADMRSRGITAQKFPGLYKRGGRQALDNVPASEHEIFAGRSGVDPAGYLDQQAFIDGLEAEMKGTPWMKQADQKAFDDLISPLDDLEMTLDQMGINYNTMSNERVKERIKEIEDAEAIYARDTGQDALFQTTRSLKDIEAEARAEAEAAGRDPDIAAADAVKPKIYINHARINSADDVKAVIQQMADTDADAINLKRRGVVTNEQTLKESDAEYKDLNDLIGRAPGPMTAAQGVAARRLLTSSGEQLVQLAKIAEGANASPADIYNFRRAMAVHYAIQSEVVAARTETARALQAWAIPAGASKQRSEAIADLIAQSGGAGDIQSLAKAVSAAGDNPTAVNVMARELGRGRFGAALYQVWINGLLSSPKTHAVNILSNSLTALYAIPERYMAAGISKIFYDGEIEAGEAVAQAFGMVKGIRDGVRLLYQGNKAEGAQGLSDVFDAFVKVEGTHQNAISADAFGLDPAGGLGWGIDFVGKFVNAPGSALNGADKFFKTWNYRMELNALAYRTAAREGLDGKEAAERITDILQNPPDNLKADAIDTALYQTFTKNLGEKGQAFQNFIRKTPVLKLVVPFIRTPTNILKYTFARTPLAYASTAIRADIAAGGARAAQAHARVATGSMIMLSIMDLTSEGVVTGSGPLADNMANTDDLRRTRRAAGGPPPYSVKIGDRWYAYNRLDPIGMLMGMAADMSEAFASADVADSEMLAGAGVLAIAQNVASKSYLSGVFDFLGAMDPSNVTSTPGKYIQDFAGSLSPMSSFLRNHASAFDPVARDAKTVVYGEDNKIDPVADYIQNTINKVKRGIPGLSDELPPMRDLWGEPISKASGLGWGWDYVSPVASRADNPDPVTKAIIDNRIRIGFPDRQIEGVKLTAEEYDEYTALAGKPAKAYLDQLVASPGFDKMSDGPDGMKAEIIRDVIANFRDQAKKTMMLKNPALRDRSFEIKLDQMRTLTGQ